jgi:hypothetical protein
MAVCEEIDWIYLFQVSFFFYKHNDEPCGGVEWEM